MKNAEDQHGQGPRTSEPAFNNVLGEVLRGKHPLWRDRLGVEQTGVFPERPALKPDILVHPPNAQPVVVETEYVPGQTVEEDAIGRLGLVTPGTSDPVEQAIAVRIPEALRYGQENLPERILAAEFDYCVLSGDPASPDRWPTAGWLVGNIDDIVRCMEHAMASQRLVDEGMSVLEHGVRIATRAIRDDVETGFGDAREEMGIILNQKSGEQTDRMAMTIIANALTFHAAIAGTHGIPAIDRLQTDRSNTLQGLLLQTWSQILEEINYWPIFRVASDLLMNIRVPTARRILTALAGAAQRLAELGVTTRHDLSGRMFQSLIMDRKFLATFYTLPTSATLLAELAVRRLDFEWEKLSDYPKLRIADLSCGTGTLLSAAYNSVLSRYRHAGGDDSGIHRSMMENAVIAADIMPAAAHLCASQLSSVHPGVLFDNTRVYTMPYGVEHRTGAGTAIGSLDLIPSQQTQSLFATGQKQTRGGSDEDVRDIRLPHHSVDLVIMNPPFTRPTNHESTEVPVPSFAGFQTSVDEQRTMSARLETTRKSLDNPAGHGNAGLASNFIDLADVKVRPGGQIALVLPISVIRGASWKSARDLLASRYRDITVITIAASGSTDRAFSADTGMAEALILATKLSPESSDGDDEPALFVNLSRRPATLLEAAEVARLTRRLPKSSRTGRIDAGGQYLGNYVRAPLDEGGCASLREAGIADVMMNLSKGVLRIPRYRDSVSLSVAPLGELGSRGLVHRDIGAHQVGRPPYRGPFRIRPINPAPGYPILWGHDADRERRLVVQPDSQGEVLPGCDESAIDVWGTATRLHFNLDFQLNSQSLAACFTPEPTIGGGAWPNFRLQEESWEHIAILWANSTLGLMSFWWQGSLQQQGRSRLTISTLPELTVIDPRSLSARQLETSKEIFGEFENRQLLPANEAYRDSARTDLDKTLLVDILDLPEDVLAPLENLRLQWCNEPSVHGGKSTRPESL